MTISSVFRIIVFTRSETKLTKFDRTENDTFTEKDRRVYPSLSVTMIKQISILKHFVDSGYVLKPNEAFNLVYLKD